MLDRWETLLATHKNSAQADRPAPTLRDAALVTAIRMLADVILKRDIWM
jgi:hypothetical protein